IEPTLFLEPSDGASIYKEETFSPALTVKIFDNEEQVIEWANDTEYGLVASVFTKDIDRDLRVPFGGVKQSGLGRELGKYALDEYTEIKTISIRL
ncbi:aldehyde dehydrogenase family 1 member A3-like protein, partial [Ilyonectria destructans]